MQMNTLGFDIKRNAREIHDALKAMNFGKALKLSEAFLEELEENHVDLLAVNGMALSSFRRSIEERVDKEIEETREKLYKDLDVRVEQRVADEMSRLRDLGKIVECEAEG